MTVINAYTSRAAFAGPAALHPRLAAPAISCSARGSPRALPACADTFCTEAADMGVMAIQEDNILTSSSNTLYFSLFLFSGFQRF